MIGSTARNYVRKFKSRFSRRTRLIARRSRRVHARGKENPRALRRAVLGSAFAGCTRACVCVSLSACLCACACSRERGCVVPRVHVFFNTHIRVFFLDRRRKKIFMRGCEDIGGGGAMIEEEATATRRRIYKISFIFDSLYAAAMYVRYGV